MTQLEALNVAYEELSAMTPDDDNGFIVEAAETILRMIHVKERQEMIRKARKNCYGK